MATSAPQGIPQESTHKPRDDDYEEEEIVLRRQGNFVPHNDIQEIKTHYFKPETQVEAGIKHGTITPSRGHTKGAQLCGRIGGNKKRGKWESLDT
ncbi:hypothetical protein ACLOJK_026554 [Asimina triloba]